MQVGSGADSCTADGSIEVATAFFRPREWAGKRHPKQLSFSKFAISGEVAYTFTAVVKHRSRLAELQAANVSIRDCIERKGESAMRNIQAEPDRFHASGMRPSASMFSSAAWSRIATSLQLSFRELDIVRGTFDGKTEAEIAVDLRISSRTVHTHIERLHHKLVITDRTQLVLRVAQEFLALTAAGQSNLPPICARREHCPFRTGGVSAT